MTGDEGLWRWSRGRAHAVFTSREPGNVGAHVGDEPARVLANRAAVAELAGLDADSIAGVTQVHGADVWLDLRREPSGVGEEVRWSHGASPIEADALVTTRAGIGVAVGVADCMPIALAWGDAVAVVHAGWRGLAGGVIEAAYGALRRAAGSAVAIATEPPTAVIGPCLRACCMEVGEEVAARFPSTSIVRRPGSPRPFLDAAADARRRLDELGFVVEEIAVCTRCNERCFSHRGDGGSSGRQAVVAWRSPA